ncbi:MAG: hypothetical protein J0M04_22565 [Verrucomicrobia bacterium]|nr:hypothetical protein [Verrucomicrobiota bacterium]
MKSSSFLLVVALACATGTHCGAAIDREQEKQQVALWTGELEKALSLPPEDKFDRLWLGLRNMGYRVANMPDRSPDVTAVYSKLQQEFLSIPGHAQYFADALEAERAALKPGDFRNDYETHLHLYLSETLCHLPSPETVKVVGSYLNDERDTGSIESQKGNDVLPGPTAPMMSMKSLCDLGIEGCPVAPRPSFTQRSAKHMASLETMRKWYGKIKSGERAFSFKGQSVEYRFKPDGTWVSTPIANPPDDAPPLPPAKSAQPAPGQPPGTPPSAAAPAPVSGPAWPWITGGILTALAALAYFLKSRPKGAG